MTKRSGHFALRSIKKSYHFIFIIYHPNSHSLSEGPRLEANYLLQDNRRDNKAMNDDDSHDDFVENDVVWLNDEQLFVRDSQRVGDNDPRTTKLYGDGDEDFVQNMTDDDWEQLGRNVANNSHLKELFFVALNDDRASSFFRGLREFNSSIEYLFLPNCELSAAGVRGMVPCFHYLEKLQKLVLANNDGIGSDGFNILLRSLRFSPIKDLQCDGCGIESIEVDTDFFPCTMEFLSLSDNSISTSGILEIAKVLSCINSRIMKLDISENKIDDEGVAILVDALRSNTTLKTLNLNENEGITKVGLVKLLKLVSNISTIETTLQSNHTLTCLSVVRTDDEEIICMDEEKNNILFHIDWVVQHINGQHENIGPVDRAKVVLTQLHSIHRSGFANIQGVNHSVYSEIDPLHIPEVLTLINEYHGESELYAALKSSIIELLSTVNRKKWIQQQRDYHFAQRDYHLAKAEQLDAELAAIEVEEGGTVSVGNRSRSRKRHRT